MLKLHVVQAAHGDCLILEAPGQDGHAPKQHILIDGGASGTYTRHLQPVLEGIANDGGRLDLAVLSHIDDDHNVSRQFFSAITADRYVILADGRHGHPDLDTLVWMVEAARQQQRDIEILATNDTPSIRELLSQCKPEAYRYRLSVMDRQAHAMVVEVGE